MEGASTSFWYTSDKCEYTYDEWVHISFYIL